MRSVRRSKAPGRKRQAGRRKPARRVRKSGAKRTTDYAKLVEIQETTMAAVNDAGGNSIGGLINFALADFQRPQEVAHAYKFYRASKCEVTFIPYYNVSQTSGAPTSRLPQLYMSVDRLSNRWMAPSENEMLERGVSPRVFTKAMKLTWKPNLLQGISLETSQPADGTGAPLGINQIGYQNALPIFNKWIPTQQSYAYSTTPPNAQTNAELVPMGQNPYALRYHGAVYVPSIEGLTPGVPQLVGDIQFKVTWEFKGPRTLRGSRPIAEPNSYLATDSWLITPNTQPTTYP